MIQYDDIVTSWSMIRMHLRDEYDLERKEQNIVAAILSVTWYVAELWEIKDEVKARKNREAANAT